MPDLSTASIADALMACTSAAAMRSTLGLVIGTDVLAYSTSTGTGAIVRAVGAALTGTTNVADLVASGNITAANLSGTNTGDQNLSGYQLTSGLGTLAFQSGSFSGTSSGTNTGDQNLSGYQTVLTNSAGLLAALSDETGTGLAVFNTSPTLVTPALGVATATSVNGITIGANLTNQGNTFNGASLLVQLTAVGKYPALDGSLITGLSSGFANPMTTVGDVIIGGTSGTALRIGVGTTGQVLTVVSGSPAWATVTGLTNPMTAVGDIIIGGTSGAATRLGGYTGVNRRFFTSEGNGTSAIAPSFVSIAATDIAAAITTGGITIGSSSTTMNSFVNTVNARTYYVGVGAAPSAPTGGVHVYADTSSPPRLAWMQTDGYQRTIGGAITANRTYTLPDSSGTILTSATFNKVIQIACSDQVTDITSGAGKVTFRMPYAMTLSAVRLSLNTAPTGSTAIIDINQNGSTILSTKLSVDASEKTSTTAASAAVISTSALTDDAEITIDFDQVGATVAGKGVVVTLIGT